MKKQKDRRRINKKRFEEQQKRERLEREELIHDVAVEEDFDEVVVHDIADEEKIDETAVNDVADEEIFDEEDAPRFEEPCVEIFGLTKKFGKTVALDGLDLTVMKGHVLGILGPNGSGKTTLIKTLAGLSHPDQGVARICGHEIGVETKAITSYLPDINVLSPDMKIGVVKKFYNDFYEDFDEEKCDRLMTQMNIPKDARVSELSKGYQERLMVAMVMSRNAELYILDEPIGGVDPLARDMILDAIIENIGDNSTMIITTHLVRDMERMFDEVVFIRDGSIALQGNAEILRDENGCQLDDLYKKIFE